jgi:hypothetical protein
MKMTLLTIIFGLLSFGWITDSSAQPKAIEKCQVYTRDSSDIPDDIQQFLSKLKNSAIRVCHTPSREDPVRYDVYSGRWMSASGVCYEKSTQVFHTYDAAGKFAWSYLKDRDNGREMSPRSQLFMAIATGTCPLQGDARYVAVNAVSEGVFVQVESSWKEISANEAAFDKAFFKLPSADKEGADLQVFKRAVLSRKEGALPIDSISYQGPLPDSGLTVPTTHISSRYLIRFQDSTDPARSFELEADITRGGLEIFDFRIALK